MQATSTIPPRFPMATHLTRTVIYPYGRKGSPSYTLSLYDTGVPLGDRHGHWWGFRLYEHVKGSPSRVLFQGADVAGSENTGDVMLSLIDRLTTRPGDKEGEDTQALTPEQIAFLITHAEALRTEARRRFGWSEKLVNLRSDLEAVYHSRALKGHGARHKMVLGVCEGSGETRAQARAALERALGRQASALPRFTIGRVTGVVYAQYPHGAETVIQVIDPKNADQPLGDSARFRSETLSEANDIADTFIAEAERSAASSRDTNRPPSLRPRARAERTSIRATS